MSDLNQDNLIVTAVNVADNIANNTTNSSPFDEIRGYRTDGSEYWTARELMRFLGFNHWRSFESVITDAIADLELLESGSAFNHIAQIRKSPLTGGRDLIDYDLSRLGCYHVALACKQRTLEVAAARRYFATKTREAELNVQPVALNLSNRDLALMVIAEADRADALVAQIEQDKPCTDLGKAIIKADNNITIGSFAKMLGTGQNRYFAELRECNIIMLNSTLPYQKYIDRNVFVVTQTINNNVSYPVSLITPSGQAYLVKRHQQYIQSGITEDNMESVLPSIV